MAKGTYKAKLTTCTNTSQLSLFTALLGNMKSCCRAINRSKQTIITTSGLGELTSIMTADTRRVAFAINDIGGGLNFNLFVRGPDGDVGRLFATGLGDPFHCSGPEFEMFIPLEWLVNDMTIGIMNFQLTEWFT